MQNHPARSPWLALQSAFFALVSSAALVACADQGSSAADGSFDAVIGSAEWVLSPDASSAQPALQQMEKASRDVAFHGLRRYCTVIGSEVLEQIEEVGSDGAGGFALEIHEVVLAPASLDQNGYFIEAENAWRFTKLARDARIVNADAVAANYAVTALAESPVVAGIPCVRLSFKRRSARSDRPGDYEADYDPSTGFVLAWREFDANRQVLNSLIYEEFEYGGDLSGMTLKGRAFSATPIALGQPLGPQVKFPVHLPRFLPRGFKIVGAEVMTVPDLLAEGLPAGETSYLAPGDWFRVIATDGLEVIVFTHNAAAAALDGDDGEFTSSPGRNWKVGYGRMAGTSYVVAARASMNVVLQIVASAF